MIIGKKVILLFLLGTIFMLIAYLVFSQGKLSFFLRQEMGEGPQPIPTPDSTTSPEPSESTTPTSTPTTTSTSTNRFKFYRNEEWGFEFEYPEEWMLLENPYKSYYSKFNIWVKAPSLEGGGLYLAFSINVALPEFPYRSFAKIEKKISGIVIDGVEGIKYEYKFEGFPEIAVILPLGQYKMILGTGGDGKQYPEEFNQILTSFKFIETKP